MDSSTSPAGKVAKGFATYVKAMRVLALLLNVGMIVLNAYFLFYIYQIEKEGCKCSLGWRRTFIEVSLGLFVLMGILGLAVDWGEHFAWLSALYNGLIIAYIVVTRDYINEIRSHHCQCAQKKAFEVLNVVNIIGLFLLGVALLGVVILALFWATVGRTVDKVASGAAVKGAAKGAGGARGAVKGMRVRARGMKRRVR